MLTILFAFGSKPASGVNVVFGFAATPLVPFGAMFGAMLPLVERVAAIAAHSRKPGLRTQRFPAQKVAPRDVFSLLSARGREKHLDQ